MRFLVVSFLMLAFSGCLSAPVDDVAVPDEPEPEVVSFERAEVTMNYWTVFAADPALVPMMGADANYVLRLEIEEGASVLLVEDDVSMCTSLCSMDYWVLDPNGDVALEKSGGTLYEVIEEPAAGTWEFFIKAGELVNVNKQGTYRLVAE